MTNTNSRQVSEIKEQNRFLARTYLWMTIALLISGAVAFFTALSAGANTEQYLKLYRAFPVLAIAEIILVWYLSSRIRKISAAKAAFFFLVYSVLNGITLSIIFLVYHLDSIASIFVISAGMFASMAVYGSVTKQNIMSFGRYLFMALVGILIASVVNIFLGSSALNTMISIITVVVFTGLTAYDAQKMIKASQYAEDTEVFKKASIVPPINLQLLQAVQGTTEGPGLEGCGDTSRDPWRGCQKLHATYQPVLYRKT